MNRTIDESLPRVGLFGGTFDPPHLGHIALAKAALAQLDLDELIWIPAAKNPLKVGKPTPGKVRIELIQAAIHDQPKMSICDIELGRPGQSYTIDTLMELQHVRPANYWLVMGADSFKSIPKWKNPERLLKMCRLAVGLRPPMNKGDLPGLEGDNVDLIHIPASEISSTDIRHRIGAKKSAVLFLDPAVYATIKQHKLYGNL
ncbi:MAG: nicotinate-nucleotide adenylyltransferase [Fimbriimonadaceae bacterium]